MKMQIEPMTKIKFFFNLLSLIQSSANGIANRVVFAIGKWGMQILRSDNAGL